MAAPLAIAVKAAALVLSNDRSRNSVGWLLAAILSPLLLIIVAVIALISGGVEHNNSALEAVFYGHSVADIPAEYRAQVENMQLAFATLDNEIANANQNMEANSLDHIRIKAIFYALFFAEAAPQSLNISAFVACFYDSEEKTKEVISIDENGEQVTETETYIVHTPIESMETIYNNIANHMGKQATMEDMLNATEIYYQINYGISAPTDGLDYEDLLTSWPNLAVPFVGIDGFVEPVAGWQDAVTSEFGNRIHPIYQTESFHSGIDLGYPAGTPIYAVLDGTVTMSTYNGGYGNYIKINHGGGFETAYAHCSQLLVDASATVKAGDIIALVGTTGTSTGNHLHFETIVNGEAVNPRSYLPTELEEEYDSKYDKNIEN